MVVTGEVTWVCTGTVLLGSRAWKTLDILLAGTALPLLGFLGEFEASSRVATAPGKGFLGVLSMQKAVANDST